MIYVTSVTVTPSHISLPKNEGRGLRATVLPCDATCREVSWRSSNECVVTVNQTTGFLYAHEVGTATVYATAKDGSGVRGSCQVTVTPPVPITSIEVCPESLTMDVGETFDLDVTWHPSNATNKTVTFTSSDSSVACIGRYSRRVTAVKAGVATITATSEDGGFTSSMEVWVKGQTPVFLIHGRTDNSENAWGVVNGIPNGKNSHYDSGIYAMAKNGKRYINVASQEVIDFVPNNGEGDAERPCNLGNELRCAGYQKNINLFVFNYPNQDAVKNSALKFKAYIDNLFYYVRQVGSNEMKACFYASKEDYENNCYKINIVGHSMGGLVARYYIENLCQDAHVDKLITIDTPHWGSGYANLSNTTGNLGIIGDNLDLNLHALCDHDLDFNSAMFGGSKAQKHACEVLPALSQCMTYEYEFTDELQYQRPRSTKYYAIAGVDYPAGASNRNNHCFEMPTGFTNVNQIADWFEENDVYFTSFPRIKIIPREVGDNMVGLLSQIGWIGDNPSVNQPEPCIQMEKVFIDVDTDGGNGGGAFIWEAVLHSDDLFHCKVNHRQEVCDKVIEYLED